MTRRACLRCRWLLFHASVRLEDQNRTSNQEFSHEYIGNTAKSICDQGTLNTSGSPPHDSSNSPCQEESLDSATVAFEGDAHLSLRFSSRSDHVAFMVPSNRNTSSFSARTSASVVKLSRRSQFALSRVLCVYVNHVDGCTRSIGLSLTSLASFFPGGVFHGTQCTDTACLRRKHNARVEDASLT